MKAMLLHRLCRLADNPAPLTLADLPDPVPAEDEILVKVTVCGVCHTELDEIEGRTPPPRFPIVPGHQVVGQVVDQGASAGDAAYLDVLLRETTSLGCRSVPVTKHHLQRRMETTENRLELSHDVQRRIYARLADASIFEEFVRFAPSDETGGTGSGVSSIHSRIWRPAEVRASISSTSRSSRSDLMRPSRPSTAT